MCQSRVLTYDDFHVNARPVCIQCNAEMEPWNEKMSIETRDSKRINTLEETLREALIPLAALVLSGECTEKAVALSQELKQAVLKSHDTILEILPKTK